MYLYVYTDNFGFKDPKINEILEDDIEISEEVYNKFFEEQAKGKQFEIKNKHGKTFEEIFEEIKLEPIDEVTEPSPIEKLKKEIEEQKKRSEKAIMELTNLILNN